MPQRLRRRGRDRAGSSSLTPPSVEVRGEFGQTWAPSSADLLEGAPERRSWPELWAARPRRLWPVATALALLAVAAAALLVDRARESPPWQVAVSASLGVDTISNDRDGGGRVDHYVAVVNEGPQPVRVHAVRVFEHRLRARSLLADATAVPSGGTAFLPLSVGLDCRRAESLRPSSTARGSVEVRTADGDEVLVPVVLAGAEPLTHIAATLCGLDPALVVAELSGPVRSTAGGTDGA